MKNILFTVLRVATLAIAFTVLFTIASSVTTSPDLTQSMTQEQIAQSTAVLPLVSLTMTLVLSYLALRSRWHGWRLAGALFLVLYGVYTFVNQIETIAFGAVSSQMPEGTVSGFFIAGLLLSVPFSLLAVWILRKTRKDAAADAPSDRLQMAALDWAWKLAAAVVLYEIMYFSFGYYVAWRTPGLPEFYGGTDPGTFLGQLGNVLRDTPWLPLLQVFRGLIWTGLACVIIRLHKGKAWEIALATGLTFSVLTTAPTLFPNPFMPPDVMRAHTIELLTSDFLFGILVTILLLWRPKRGRAATGTA